MENKIAVITSIPEGLNEFKSSAPIADQIPNTILAYRDLLERGQVVTIEQAVTFAVRRLNISNGRALGIINALNRFRNIWVDREKRRSSLKIPANKKYLLFCLRTCSKR